MSPIRPGGSWRAWCLKGLVTRPAGGSTSFRVRKNGDFTWETGWFHSNMGDLTRKTYFLRVIPSLKHYSDIVSDIPSGSIYGIFILTFYLTFFLAYTLIYLSFYLASILTYFLAYILTFFLASIWNLSWHSIRHSFQAFILAFFLASVLTFSLTFFLVFYLTFSLSVGWGLAVPTAIWSWRLRSGSAHCHLALAVAVRQCPLRSGARSWSPAAHWNLELAVDGQKEGRRRRKQLW